MKTLLILSILFVSLTCSHTPQKHSKQHPASKQIAVLGSNIKHLQIQEKQKSNKYKSNKRLKTVKNLKGLNNLEVQRNHFITLRALPAKIPALKKRFNERATKSLEHIANKHNQSMNQVITLKFDGAKIRIYKNDTYKNSEALLGLKLIKAKPQLGLSIDIGDSRKQVEKFLDVETANANFFESCELQEITQAGPIYGSSCVTFYFKNDKVIKMEWILPLD